MGMDMKITLIELPHVYLIQQKTQAPIGLMYMAAVLEKKEYDVNIVRLDSLDIDVIPDSDIYGISSVSLDYSSAKEVAKKIKDRKNGKVIIGGYHATVETESVLNEKYNEDFLWDSVFSGEADFDILILVQDYINGEMKRLYNGTTIKDLDLIPFPSRHLILNQGGSIFAYDKHYTDNKLSTVISSSRGCCFRCAFCATQKMWGGKVRFRSAKNLIEEITECIEKYNIREFRFSDELFTSNKERTRELMKWFIGKDIFWKCSTRVDCVDQNLLEIMKEAGCMEIAFGIESADEKVLLAINKKTKTEVAKKALIMCNDIGINTRSLMMINTPGETVDTVDKNIDFLNSVPYTCASLSVFKPLPGSPVWYNPDKYGIKIIDRDLDKYNIYMWRSGTLDENNSEDVFEILTLPSVEKQIENRKRMIDYFFENMKMNEIDKIISLKNGSK
jgi:anaerobic magnesium-protoporphyrin IX monomethyl ester cyclase